MFKLTLRISLSLFVASSVLCLTCYQTDTWRCQIHTISKWFFDCMAWHAYAQCESPKLCLRGVMKAPQFSGREVPIRGCALTQDCEKIMHELLDPYIPEVTPNLTVEGCRNCSDSDLCNLFGDLIMIPGRHKHKRPHNKKDLKVSKNSTAAPSAPPKKKSRGSRSTFGITTIHQVSIYLNILLLMILYF